MDSARTAAQSRWLCVPQTVTASRLTEVKQQLEALGPQGELHGAAGPKPDPPDNNSHIWIIEETKFAYRTMVQS